MPNWGRMRVSRLPRHCVRSDEYRRAGHIVTGRGGVDFAPQHEQHVPCHDGATVLGQVSAKRWSGCSILALANLHRLCAVPLPDGGSRDDVQSLHFIDYHPAEFVLSDQMSPSFRSFSFRQSVNVLNKQTRLHRMPGHHLLAVASRLIRADLTLAADRRANPFHIPPKTEVTVGVARDTHNAFVASGGLPSGRWPNLSRRLAHSRSSARHGSPSSSWDSLYRPVALELHILPTSAFIAGQLTLRIADHREGKAILRSESRKCFQVLRVSHLGVAARFASSQI